MSLGYDRNVFINCPFDDGYRRIFHAIVYTVHECGFTARCSLEVEDGGEERIRRVKRLIRECRYGVHDISRVDLDKRTGLPRFNMPLELGLFLGAQEYGDELQARKRSLILDAEPYRYREFCSDIAGQDVRAHRNDPGRAMAAVRALLATSSDRRAWLPGEKRIRERYRRFREELPAFCGKLHVRRSEMQFIELRSMIQIWLDRNPL